MSDSNDEMYDWSKASKSKLGAGNGQISVTSRIKSNTSLVDSPKNKISPDSNPNKNKEERGTLTPLKHGKESNEESGHFTISGFRPRYHNLGTPKHNIHRAHSLCGQPIMEQDNEEDVECNGITLKKRANMIRSNKDPEERGGINSISRRGILDQPNLFDPKPARRPTPFEQLAAMEIRGFSPEIDETAKNDSNSSRPKRKHSGYNYEVGKKEEIIPECLESGNSSAGDSQEDQDERVRRMVNSVVSED